MLKHGRKKLLSRCTSLKIGGPIFYWVEPENMDEVLDSISLAQSKAIDLAIIGRGTNILGQDRGWGGVIIRLGKAFDYIKMEPQGIVKVGGACCISRLVKETAEKGLSGCEFLAGIPGSFGGAVFMNTGVRDIKDRDIMRELKDIILDVDVIDLEDKKSVTLDRRSIGFTYRSSGLDGKCVLGGRIKLKNYKKGVIINRITSFMEKRRWIQKLSFPSAGSVFKNPDQENAAGRLIELCGLKGKRIGGAGFSDAHANFIVNIDRAKSRDVLGLIELAQDNVKRKFGIDLELELRIL